MCGLGTFIGSYLVGWFGLDNYFFLSLSHLLPLAVFMLYPIPNVQTAAEAAKSNKPTMSGTS